MTVLTVGAAAALICLILGLGIIGQDERKRYQEITIRQNRDKWGEP